MNIFSILDFQKPTTDHAQGSELENKKIRSLKELCGVRMSGIHHIDLWIMDKIFNIENNSVYGTTYNQFVDKWEYSMREVYEIATKYGTKNEGNGKNLRDKKVFDHTLKAGDRVLIRNLREPGETGKLKTYWQDEIHIITLSRSRQL